MKKGQITLFIIVGIVMFFVIGVGLYSVSNIGQEKRDVEIEEMFEVPGDVMPVKSFVDECLRKTAEEGIYFISLQGGYYDSPLLNREFFAVMIPYYWYNQSNKMPAKGIIEQELSKYIKDKLPKCINFSLFEDKGYKFEVGNISVLSNIALKSVLVEVTYPIKVHIDSEVAQLDKFTSSIDINFDEKYNFVKQIIEEQNKTPNFIPMGFIANLAYENNFTFDYMYLNEDEVLYALIFEEYKEQLIYAFLSKYNWSLNITNDSVTIASVDNQTAYVDYTFSYLVDTIGNNLTFTDYTYLFDIDEKSGLIEFTPELDDVGLYNILISVEDEFGNDDSTLLNLRILADNSPPSIKYIGFQQVNLTSTFDYQVNTSDPNNDTMFYFVNSSLQGMEIDIVTGKISYAPLIEDIGLYSIKVTAVDLHGLYDDELFNFEVKNE